MDATVFKDERGRYRTQSLFLEFEYGVDVAIYTLREEDYEYKGKKFISIKRLYMEIADPTEYEFATTCFYSWDQWQRIANNSWFKPYIEKWREELEIKLRSQAIKEIAKQSRNPKGTVAAKWLAEKGWAPKRKAGAPSKEEKERELKIQAGISEEVADDLERMAKWH